MNKPIEDDIVYITDEKTFDTTDFNLATVLISEGFLIAHIDKTNPKRATFMFHKSDALDTCAECFWNRKLSIEPRTLLEAQKMLKTRLYS